MNAEVWLEMNISSRAKEVPDAIGQGLGITKASADQLQEGKFRYVHRAWNFYPFYPSRGSLLNTDGTEHSD